MNVPFDKYIVWQCTKCGKWQGKQNNKWTPGMTEKSNQYAIGRLTLNCLRCRKSVKFKDNIKGGVRGRHFWFNHPMEATKMIQKQEELKAAISKE